MCCLRLVTTTITAKLPISHVLDRILFCLMLFDTDLELVSRPATKVWSLQRSMLVCIVALGPSLSNGPHSALQTPLSLL